MSGYSVNLKECWNCHRPEPIMPITLKLPDGTWIDVCFNCATMLLGYGTETFMTTEAINANSLNKKEPEGEL